MEQNDGDDSEQVAAAREKASRLLGRRGHAEAELRRKLSARDFEPDVVDTVIEQLHDSGALDDERFAIHQAELLRDKLWGPRQIRKKLSDKGVGSHHIDAALAAVGGGDTWLRGCWRRARSKFGSDPESWSDSKMKRAFRHLSHRGYRKSTIRRICFDGVVPEENE